jgi:hypothetical protein
MFTILAKTPLYVWPLLFGLIFSGLKATKTSVAPLKIFWILPSFFLTLATYTAIHRYGAAPSILSLWIGSLLLGVSMGLPLGRRLNVRFDKTNQKVEMPGSYFTLTLALTIFCSKFFIGMASSLHPEWIGTWILLTPEMLASLACGTFIGRSISLLKKYKSSPHTTLT